MKNPTQCALWNKTELTPFDLDLELVRIFTHEDHIKKDLLRCRECGQLYFHEWYEHVYFKRDADMYDSYIPVETEEEIAKLSKVQSSAELIKFVPQLHGSFTNSEKESLRWVTNNTEEYLPIPCV